MNCTQCNTEARMRSARAFVRSCFKLMEQRATAAEVDRIASKIIAAIWPKPKRRGKR